MKTIKVKLLNELYKIIFDKNINLHFVDSKKF